MWYLIAGLLAVLLLSVVLFSSVRRKISSLLKPLGLDDEFDAITAGLSKTVAKLEAYEGKLETRKAILEADVQALDAKQTDLIKKHEDTDAEISRVSRVKHNVFALIS